MTGPTNEERHEQHHQHLAELQAKVDRIEASAYANAKKQRNRAPRKFARRSSYSHRVSQVAAWRSHLQGLHGVKDIGPFVGLADLQEIHTTLHDPNPIPREGTINMQQDYYRSEITQVIDSGPAGGPEYKFQVRVFGEHVSKHLRASADQLRCVADVLDETNPPSLLPLQNGHRVIMAETWFDGRGIGEGVVLAEHYIADPESEWVTWHVYLHKGECRWLADAGDYFHDLNKATAAYFERCSEVHPS